MLEHALFAAVAVVSVLALAWTAVVSNRKADQRAERDALLIRRLADAIVLGNQHDLQIKRIENETVGEGMRQYNESLKRVIRSTAPENGWRPPEEEPGEARIPSNDA